MSDTHFTKSGSSPGAGDSTSCVVGSPTVSPTVATKSGKSREKAIEELVPEGEAPGLDPGDLPFVEEPEDATVEEDDEESEGPATAETCVFCENALTADEIKKDMALCEANDWVAPDAGEYCCGRVTCRNERKNLNREVAPLEPAVPVGRTDFVQVVRGETEDVFDGRPINLPLLQEQ